jgi:hypothetical protein
MDSNAQREIEWDCTQPVTAFYGLLDDKRYDALVELFTQDGVWVRLGQDLVGKDRIRAAMAGRDTWITLHVLGGHCPPLCRMGRPITKRVRSGLVRCRRRLKIWEGRVRKLICNHQAPPREMIES